MRIQTIITKFSDGSENYAVVCAVVIFGIAAVVVIILFNFTTVHIIRTGACLKINKKPIFTIIRNIFHFLLIFEFSNSRRHMKILIDRANIFHGYFLGLSTGFPH